MYPSEAYGSWTKAGKIAAKALAHGKSLIKPGVQVKEVLDKIEAFIAQHGGKPAFPAQISLNHVAAHNCPTLDDETILEDQVIKLDCGVHIDGYVADNALTVDLSGKYGDLVKASREALNNVLKIIRPGLALGEIGKTIQETITSYGFSPIRNLSGHGVGQFIVHTVPTLPNFANNDTHVLEEGMAVACEPFASTGAGIVKESGKVGVFALIKDTGIRDPITRAVLAEIKTYGGLPFAKRWLEQKFTIPKTNFAFLQLKRNECLRSYPPLVDQANGIVSQAEHTIIVREKPIVITKREEE